MHGIYGVRDKLLVHVLGDVLDERERDAYHCARLERRERAQELHGSGVSSHHPLKAAVRLGRHKVLADEEQLRDDAQDVEVDAEREEEAGVSASEGRPTPRAG